jgi:hypothetical protein
MRLTQAAGLVMLKVGSRRSRLATPSPAVTLRHLSIRSARRESEESL